MDTKTETDRIPTSLRTLLLLETIGNAGRPMTASEIGSELGLAKQTVHRLCNTLEDEGFLTRQANTKRYMPARRSRGIASGLLFSSRSHISRHQVLEDVASQVGETVNFVIPEKTGMRYLDRVETDWLFRVQFPVGSNVPFHCTASGKTFMAAMAPKARKAFVHALTLDVRTGSTLSTPERLLDELKETARRGYALDNEEFVEGMVAVAVPILDPKGRFAAALACHGPVQRISIEGAVRRKDILAKGAKRLTEVLFFE